MSLGQARCPEDAVPTEFLELLRTRVRGCEEAGQ